MLDSIILNNKITAEFMQSPLIMKVQERSSQIKTKAESYLDTIKQNLQVVSNLFLEEYNKCKNYQEAVEAIRSKLTSMVQEHQQFQQIQTRFSQNQQSLVQLQSDMSDKLFLAQVTLEYLRNMMFNPAVTKLNVIFHHSQEQVSIVFDYISNLSLEATKQVVMEKIQQFNQNVTVTFLNKKIKFTFDKQAIYDNFLLVIDEIQQLVKNLREMDYRQKAIEVQQKALEFGIKTQKQSKAIYQNAVSKVQQISENQKLQTKQLYQQALQKISDSKQLVQFHASQILEIANNKKQQEKKSE